MAGTSVLKLKVDDKEYNSSLKKAQQGLQHLEQSLKDAGKSITQVDKSVVDYVRGIGQMEAQSKTARGRIGEMSNAFIELSLQYKNMSDEVKSSDVGKALAESMEQLKQRTIEAKNELDSLNGELNNVKIPDIKGNGIFSGMGDKMSGAIQVFAGNMMTKAAGAVAELGSEIFASVQQGIELAKQGEGIRIAFERLGRGDILDGLREATHGTVTDLELMKAAVKFNDFKLPLDELGTMLAFAQQKAKDTGQSVDYMVDSIVTGLGRKSLMILDNLGLSAAEIKDRMKETGDMTKAVADIIQERMAAAGGYVETASDRAAKATADLENAMTSLGETFAPLVGASDSLWNSIKIGAINALNTAVKPLIQALSEAGTLGQGARATAGFGNLGGNTKVDRMIGRLGNGKTAGAYSIYTQQLGEFDKYINNKRFQIAAYGGDNSSVAQSAKARLQTELDGALKMRAEYVKRAQELHNQVPSPFNPATTSGGATGGGSNKNGIDAAGDWSKALRKGMDDTDSLKKAVDLISPFAMMTEEAKKQMLGLNEATRDWGGAMAEIGNQKVLDEIDAATKRIEQQQKATDLAAQSAMNLGAALSNIEDPGMKAAGTVLSAVANIALGFSQAAAQASSLGPYAWIAYLAAGTAAMATTISTIHSLTGYAQGGIVDGNSYSGDNIPIMANAGELVLTKAAQASLANHLEGGGMSGLGPSRISGEQIYITLNRYLKRSGQGELMTWG